jgi:hypothetical protein
MQIQPQHHDGEGTSASLYDFLNEPALPETDLARPRRSASRDIAATVERLRARQIAPMHVPTKHTGLTQTLSLIVANAMALWIIYAIVSAFLAGRL